MVLHSVCGANLPATVQLSGSSHFGSIAMGPHKDKRFAIAKQQCYSVSRGEASMNARWGVLLSVALITGACGSSHGAVQGAHDGVASSQGAAGDRGAAGSPSSAGNDPRAQSALSDSGSGGASGSAFLGASGASGAATRGMAAGDTATSDGVSADAVARDCMEELQCTGVDSAATTLATCVTNSLELLNQSPAATQQQFERLVAACASFKACEYVACAQR
jgi:hypothetical protein